MEKGGWVEHIGYEGEAAQEVVTGTEKGGLYRYLEYLQGRGINDIIVNANDFINLQLQLFKQLAKLFS